MTSEAALWQAIYAAPDDDAPRAVLADVLQERGDPRGELIALQLREHAGHASAEAIARATRLVKELGVRWLGNLHPITRYATMQRGFLHRVMFANISATTDRDRLLADPAFGTVEEIDVWYQEELVARVMASPASTNLRELTIHSKPGWMGFVANPPPRLERLIYANWTQRPGFTMRDEYAAGFVEHVLPFVERSPRITTLGLELELLPHLSQELRARLRGIVCRAGLDEALRLWDDLRLERLVISRPFAGYHVTKLELVRNDDHELVRIDEQAVSRGVTHQQAAAHLMQLPRRLEVLELIGNKHLAKWLRDHHAARFKISTRSVPSARSFIRP